MNHEQQTTNNKQRIMQNKPNLLDAQMNVNPYNTKEYNNETAFRRGKNKPNSNPIQTQSNPISKMPKWM